MSAPQVSVIIPAFNAGSTIAATLRSVFDQTYRDFEIIVVDDGSSDDTGDQVSAFGDRVVYIRQPNGGPARARNVAIDRARGRYIALLDADDAWMPEKLQRQMEYFEEFPQSGLVHAATVVDAAPLSAIHARAGVVAGRPAFEPPRHVFAEVFHGTIVVQALTAIAPRAVVVDVGGFDERREIHVEDWDLWLRIAARHPLGYVPERLAVYRPGGGMSGAFEKTFRGQELVIAKTMPLCAAHCVRQRGDVDACVRERKAVLYGELAYLRFWTGNMEGAADAYRRAIACGLTTPRARAYRLAAATLARLPVRAISQVKKATARGS